MAMKGYSAFPKVPALLEPHYQNFECYIQDINFGGLPPTQQGCTQSILQPQATGLSNL